MRLKKFLSVLCAVITAVLACGCTANRKNISVAVIVKAVDSDFWHKVSNGVSSAATEYNVDVTFEGPENEEDYEKQNEMINRAVEKGVDAIVLSAIDYKKNSDAVTKAVKNGVKVITIDSSVASKQVSMFIGTDNKAAGRAAGKAAADTFIEDGRVHIGIVNYYKSTDNGIKREEGFREYIDSVKNADIAAAVNTESNTGSAAAAAEALLKENPQINVLVGFNEWMTLGIGEAVKNLGLSEKVRCIGFDTNVTSLGMLETGEMDVLIVQNPFAIGFLGIKNAVDIVNGTASSQGELFTDVTAVTKNNIFDKDIQKLLFGLGKRE